jgi:hypothetical protein
VDNILHTFALEAPLQYFGASLENAEFLAPLSFSQNLVLNLRREKCELRDVIYTFPWFPIKACCFHSRKKVSYLKNGGFSYLLETACQPILK